MSRHEFRFAPALWGGARRYIIDFAEDESPRRFWTITAPMLSWPGEVVGVSPGRARALIRQAGRQHEVEGIATSRLMLGGPCIVMEHLTVSGEMGYMIGRENIMDGQRNFVNFGIPGGRHIRIDIYTGESKIINA